MKKQQKFYSGLKILFLFTVGLASMFSCNSNANYLHPEAVNKDATEITDTSAVLNASILPYEETVYPAFIITTSYDSLRYYPDRLRLTGSDPATILPGEKYIGVKGYASHLKPKTTYYFTVVLLNDFSMFGYVIFRTL